MYTHGSVALSIHVMCKIKFIEEILFFYNFLLQMDMKKENMDVNEHDRLSNATLLYLYLNDGWLSEIVLSLLSSVVLELLTCTLMGAWHSPYTLLTTVHSQAFLTIPLQRHLPTRHPGDTVLV
jgi:hypothetical protein